MGSQKTFLMSLIYPPLAVCRQASHQCEHLGRQLLTVSLGSDMKVLHKVDRLLTVSLLCAVSTRVRGNSHSFHRVHAQPQKRVMSSSRQYPAPLVVPPAGNHSSTVLIIHGLGDSGAGWVDFAPELSSGTG